MFPVVRVLRLQRVFRVLKMGESLQASELLWRSIVAWRRKICVFLLTIITLVIIIGAMMDVIKGPQRSFRSIPVGIYWATVTITTVGYGDVTPVTPLGRLIASAVMLLGYSIIAVTTGIVTAEIGGAMGQRRRQADRSSQRATACGREGHEADARHCKHCGALL